MLTEKLNERDLLRKAYLLPLHKKNPKPIEIQDFLSIGRDLANQVVLDDPYASQRHARIEKRSEGHCLRDQRSRNGTYVNGVRILEAYLQDGDSVQIGNSQFSFTSSAEVALVPQSLVSKNVAWNRTLESLPVFAKSQLPVLLLGPSGTGKDVLARAIHQNSTRAKGPFVSVNCSSLGESLVESELFGHIRGGFTGATNDRRGAFESARGGTLFLDEIGDLPLSIQPKLLRALENKEIRPVGSDRTIGTDVRIIAATHHNLKCKVAQGTFRSDLYFRLHVVRIEVPHLTDRPEDFEDILREFCRENQVSFSIEAIEALKRHSWPGNIRELKNTVARASALLPGQRISADHLDRLIDNLGDAAASVDSPNTASLPVLRELEKEIIKKRLLANHGNQRRTAVDLNMPKSTLNDRIRSYGIDVKELLGIL